jgi:ketosteroid isomerase-like protein
MRGIFAPVPYLRKSLLEAKVHGGQEITPYALRVTMIFGPEEGAWRVAHRHADQITPPQPAESAVQR